VARLNHLADRAADHDVADRDRCGVGARVAHPAAHVGVEGQVQHAEQDLTVASSGSSTTAVAKSLFFGAPTGRAASRIWVVFTVSPQGTIAHCGQVPTGRVRRFRTVSVLVWLHMIDAQHGKRSARSSWRAILAGSLASSALHATRSRSLRYR
jgi:hypothetical protein